jgi:hypothetical protein
MKKLLLISMLIGALPFSMQAQDDDLYFVPKKKSVEKSVVETNVSQPVTYTDNSRSIDEYNRRMKSSYQVIDGDTVKNDIIEFSAEKGVYPDSLKEEKEDFELTKKMSRFDDYQLADNAAFWAGYQAGLDTWAWHSPWYYSRYGWYGGWYDPWYSPYYYSWRYGWYDPWYYSYYGWYDPWYYGYYGYYGYPYRVGWYYPYWGGYYGSIGRSYYAHNHIGTGTIRSDGSTHAYRHGNSVSGNSSRLSSMRDRGNRMGGNSGSYSSGNNNRSNSGNFSGYRGNTGNSNSGARSSNSSFGGSRSSGGGGGSFSGGGGSRGGGGGGGSRLGGRR